MIEPKLAKLRKMINDIKLYTILAETDLVGFCKKWEQMQQKEIETEVQPLLEAFNKFVVDQNKLADRIDLLLTPRKINIDPMLNLQNWRNVNAFGDVVADRKIDMAQLLTCFAAILPQIETKMSKMEYPSANQIIAKVKFLAPMPKRLDSMIVRLGPMNEDAINQSIATNDVDPMFMQFSSLSAHIKSMLMNTPAIADPRLRLPEPSKRPRIFAIASDEPFPAIEYFNGTRNMSMIFEEEAAMQPTPKRLRACDSATGTEASATLVWNKIKSKSSAIEVLKSIRTKNVVEPPKKGRQSMLPQSFMQSTLLSDCNTFYVEPNPRIPFTADSSNQISMVIGASPAVSMAAMPKNTRKRLSLDGN